MRAALSKARRPERANREFPLAQLRFECEDPNVEQTTKTVLVTFNLFSAAFNFRIPFITTVAPFLFFLLLLLLLLFSITLLHS